MSTVSSSRYAFLSTPPQLKQKKRPVQLKAPVNVPLPLTVVATPDYIPATSIPSATFASITLWAQAVQPGSPAPRSPPSPYRNGRRGSVSSLRRARRASITHHRVCSTSGSFLHIIDTPTTSSGFKNTPSVKDLTFDLKSLGYTFVPLPNTPATPSLRNTSSQNVSTSVPSTPPPKTPVKAKSGLSLKRIRSLGVLKPLRTGRRRSKSITSSNASVSKPASPTRPRSKSKAKSKTPLPPTLTNDLLLLQFMDGGSLEKNMKRVMEKQAKREAKNAKSNSGELAVADAHRDAQGGLWRDQDEEMEYKPLLTVEDEDWVRFEDNEPVSTAIPSSKIKTPRKRPAPLMLAGAASSSPALPQGFEDSFVPPASAPAEEKPRDTKPPSKWTLFMGKN